MTALEVVEQALARAAEFSDSFPQARSVMYRRISIRQQQLYERAARINPEWGGVETIATLDSGGLDLELLKSSDLPEIAKISRVTIEDAGASSYSVGDEVRIVRPVDAFGNEAPRATVRDRVLAGFDGDLDDVTSLRIAYAQIPVSLASTEDGSTELELRDPHAELLVIDLARSLLEKAQESDSRDRGVGLLIREEKAGLEAFGLHVAAYAGGIEERF